MLSPPSAAPPRARVTNCPQPDCNVTFHDNDLVYLHLTRIHPGAKTHTPDVNIALSASLTKFLEEKNQHFKKPPRKMEPDEIALLVCHETLCKQTFSCENLRDFHYNRMHHSRHHSMLSQLTETEKNKEQRKRGYDCAEADCDARFLCAELRDFHYARAHPLLWIVTQERQVNTLIRDEDKRNEGEEKTLGESFKCDSRTNTPHVEMSDISPMQSEFNKSSICESEGRTGGEEVDTTVVERKVKILAISESSPTNRYPIFQYRSKSEMMMNRNALANPGASKWAIRP